MGVSFVFFEKNFQNFAICHLKVAHDFLFVIECAVIIHTLSNFLKKTGSAKPIGM